MDDIHIILKTVSKNKKDKFALATIIEVKGSSYRKVGSSMLFSDNGEHIGLLSGGCVEEDLQIRVQDNFQTNLSSTFKYHLGAEDDLSWGQGSGCNGEIYVLVEPINAPLQSYLSMLKDYLDKNERVSLVRRLNEKLSVMEYLFLPQNGPSYGNWTTENHAIDFFKHGGLEFNGNSKNYLYIQHFYPKPRLIIFGAGPDIQPLAKIATQTGFSVTIIDWRPTLCNKTNYPDADLIVGYLHETLKKVPFSPVDFVLIMTHIFEKDQEIAQQVTKQGLRYIGILGPRERTKRLFKDQHIPKNVYSPIGLVKAKGPKEIAISILAEIIQVLNDDIC